MFHKSHARALLVAAAFAIACSDSNGPDDLSRVRTVNASPDAPSLNFVLDGTTIQSSIAYATDPTYMDVDEDADHATLTNSSSGATLVANDVHLETNRNYSMIAVGKLASISSIFVEDSQDAPVSGKSKVRFIQTAPSMPASVDVYITSPGADLATTSPTLSNVAFKSVSSYLLVDAANDYRLRITAAGSKTTILDVPSVNLPSGGIRTLLSLDASGGGGPFSNMNLVDKN